MRGRLERLRRLRPEQRPGRRGSVSEVAMLDARARGAAWTVLERPRVRPEQRTCPRPHSPSVDAGAASAGAAFAVVGAATPPARCSCGARVGIGGGGVTHRAAAEPAPETSGNRLPGAASRPRPAAGPSAAEPPPTPRRHAGHGQLRSSVWVARAATLRRCQQRVLAAPKGGCDRCSRLRGRPASAQQLTSRQRALAASASQVCARRCPRTASWPSDGRPSAPTHALVPTSSHVCARSPPPSAYH